MVPAPFQVPEQDMTPRISPGLFRAGNEAHTIGRPATPERTQLRSTT
jgi:hypothetical protein